MPISPIGPDGGPELDDLLCFATYGAGLAFNRVYRRLLDRHGLTYPQYLVLVVLWQDDNVTIGRLGEQLSLDTNTLTPMVKRLEAMGFVKRRRDRADERRVLVALTEKGRDVRQGAEDIMHCIAEACGLSPERLESLTSEMRTLRRHLEAYAEEDMPR